MVVNLGLTETLFGIWLIGGVIVIWPDVPWTLLLVGGIVLNLVVPVTYYPLSKTTWMGLHLMFVPPEPSEEADANAARATQPDDTDRATDERGRVGEGDEPEDGETQQGDGHPDR